MALAAPRTLAPAPTRETEKATSSASGQAFRILHFGFTLAPLLAGIDKFPNLLTNWENYLSPWVTNLLPLSASTFMRAVGVVEIAAGLLVWFRPRWGAWVVAAWLVGIILNLLTLPGYFDIAVRDLGLALGATALGVLSREQDPA